MTASQHDRIVVLDFGSQYTHLIVRSIRELGVYAEILPHNTPVIELKNQSIKGFILSGGPRSVYDKEGFQLPKGWFKWQKETGTPVLGICYGLQLISHSLGGKVTSVDTKEYGFQTLKVKKGSRLLAAMSSEEQVWMSHGDQVGKLPAGFKVIATTETCPVAAFENLDRDIYGVQFHPEVIHTKRGMEVLRTFVLDICGCKPTWRMEDFISETIKELKELIGDEKVIMGVSGGVDSTVAALLLQQAIGNQLHCVLVDIGLMRSGEIDWVTKELTPLLTHFHVVDASELFLSGLKDVIDPEEKRHIIASAFIEVFQHTATELEEKYGEFTFLGQGTINPDRIESGATSSSSARIKSHHNVTLPEALRLKVVEPLHLLYKDEVRAVGRKLGLSDKFIRRHPFPGPALAVRIVGMVTTEKLRIVREADLILLEELERAGVYEEIWQAFAAFLPVQSVGVMGDERTFEYAIALRAVVSRDAMTARAYRFDWELLERIGTRIINEVKGVNRVFYDISSKPPSTIELL
jgi:GMP synthase (glutamine-hydrolysing)